MGYATTLYAVDLNALSSSVGSRNAGLIKRFQKEVEKKTGRGKREMQGPRVKLTLNSEIELNGQLVSWDEFKAAIRNPKWKGTYLFTFQENGKRKGRWSKPGSFAIALGEALAGTKFLGTMVCNSDAELRSGWQDDDEISVEQAALELLAGKITRSDAGHQYAYALERLCRVLGTRLATIEGKRGLLTALELDTPLSEERSPVALPKRADFPGIGYLTAEEVQGEVERLRVLDLSFPQSLEIEQDRMTLLKSLQKAARKRVGVVAFYY